MSTATISATTVASDTQVAINLEPKLQPSFEEILQQVAKVVAPVWPLMDYVAVNPYFGVSDQSFLDTRSYLRSFSDCEMLMPLAYYAHQYHRGQFGVEAIEAAIEELQSVGITPVTSARELADRLETLEDLFPSNDPSTTGPHHNRPIHTMAELVNRQSAVDWSEAIRDEVSKYCAAHYDDGQATWQSPWKHLSLYEAWQAIAEHDRNIEALGLTGFREFVQSLPATPEAAIELMLERLSIPRSLWSSFLLCQAFSVPGWSAWAKYQDSELGAANDFAGLLAIRLAYDTALHECFAIDVEWESLAEQQATSLAAESGDAEDDPIARYVLLRASEIGYRTGLLDSLVTQPLKSQQKSKLAQMVFCIDVRSERIRRQLEATADDIETFGFAGFFGMPIEYVPLGESAGKPQLPVLLKPQFKMEEGLSDEASSGATAAVSARRQGRSWRKLWKGFQTSAVGCFTFVETTGLWFGIKLLGRALGIHGQPADGRFDGVSKQCRDKLGPTLRSLQRQGFTDAKLADLAESMLKNLGLTKDFARFVAFCGHASQTDNNPLAAGLDCGACAGHSGEPNARMAAKLLNYPPVRDLLADRGIEIPATTHFLGGLHNTTTDEITFFDLDDVPESHRQDLKELQLLSSAAGKRTCEERMPIVASKTLSDLLRRANDWSEVRPEWGLAGNAAFVVAPRWMTKDANLGGRSFLHSYDHKNDPDGSVLELIMTAPMVVANWINMQYYASTVDNHHFGSGNKTVHNVVGRFGILSGNGGDLMTGLPWQSLHTGQEYQHLPMRLQVVIAAPRAAIDRVIEKHEIVRNLLQNQWLHLVAIDDRQKYRYSQDGSWRLLVAATEKPFTVST